MLLIVVKAYGQLCLCENGGDCGERGQGQTCEGDMT